MIHIISCALCNQAHDTPTTITRLKHNAYDMETHNLNDVSFQSILFTNSLLKQNKIEWRHENIALIIQKSRKRDKK